LVFTVGDVRPMSFACRLKFSKLPFSFLPRNAVSLLHGAQQLVAFAFDSIQVVVSQLAPLLLHLAAKLLLLAFYRIPVHLQSSFAAP
jgi:hypothetical protein